MSVTIPATATRQIASERGVGFMWRETLLRAVRFPVSQDCNGRPQPDGRYGDAVPILRDEDPRVGCLAVPVSAVAGFILFALVAAAVGVSAGVSGVRGIGRCGCWQCGCCGRAAPGLARARPSDQRFYYVTRSSQTCGNLTVGWRRRIRHEP